MAGSLASLAPSATSAVIPTLYSVLPHVSRSLLIRGGAIAAAAAASTVDRRVSNESAASDEASPAPSEASLTDLSVSGGASHSHLGDGNVSLLGVAVTPVARSVLSMALAMALHYLAYSFARPTTLSLFTSAQTGFGGKTSAYPLAMGLVSPTSLMLLFGYGGTLERLGPRAALRRSTVYCASALGITSTLVNYLQNLESPIMLPSTDISILPFLVGALFVFRESYVQLIASQHWSFMSSVLNPTQSSKWFAPISGLTSLASAGAGYYVSPVVAKLGLTGALKLAAIMLAASTLFTENAYGISEKYGFNPAEEMNKKIAAKKARKGGDSIKNSEEKHSLVKKASELFGRVPVLKALFVEILASQGVSTILNVCYVAKLSQVITDDKERAGWSGKFFAVINIVSGFLQFAILPKVNQFVEPKVLWRVMPIIIMASTTNLALDKDPTLYLVSGTFLIMKSLEFSFRRMLDEMVYVPLDFDSRYVGKEVIGVFGYRFGKSGTSLAVSALTSQFQFGLGELSWMTTVAAGWWLRCTWKLSNLVPTKAEAEDAFAKVHSKGR